MKYPLSVIFLLIALLFPAASIQAVDDIVEKTYCTQGIAYESIDDLKLDLLNNAKKAIINELFGEFIVASTAVENSVVTKDQIQTSSLGFVRVEGNTDFHNGDDFADVCVTLHGYVTLADRSMFNEIPVTYKYCTANDNLTTSQLKEFVRTEAIVKALTEYDRKLDDVDRGSLLRLMRKTIYPENAFVPDTETYCARVEGYIVPVEILALLESNGSSTTSSSTKELKEEFIVQWASKVYEFSSQYNNDGWSAKQVLGEPNITQCGDRAGSWTTSARGTQFVEVGFEKIVYPKKLTVRENNVVGFVTRLEFLNPEGDYVGIDVNDTLKDCPGNADFDVRDKIDFPTNRVKVYVNADHGGYEEIDAISLQGVELTESSVSK